jgi:mono/diheme cytochrome c family protein
MTGAVRWLALGIAVAMSWRAASLLAGDDWTKADPDDPALVGRGKAVYAEQCASCHGAKLEGQPNWRHRLPNGRMPAPPHDATGHTWHHSDKQLFDMTKIGLAGLVAGYQSDMPGFEDKLSDADIWAVLSYIESTWPPEIRQRQMRMNASRP